MPGVELCGELNPDHEDEKCVRRELHKGRHRGRRGTTWANTAKRTQYRRYVPPHRREAGAPDLSGRRYERPDNPSRRESEKLPATTEG